MNFARHSIDYFITTMNLSGIRHQIVIKDVDADGFVQLVVYHPFTELICLQFCPSKKSSFVEVVVSSLFST